MHADFIQKVPKLTVFFGECNAKQSSCEQRGGEEQKNGKKGQGREELQQWGNEEGERTG